MNVSVISHEFDDRRADLTHIEATINDQFKSKWARSQAQRAKDAIMRQIRDKKLQSLRHRMIKAAIVGDERAEWKIGNQIKSYTKNQLLVKAS